MKPLVCGATAEMGPMPPRFDVARLHTMRHTHTHTHTYALPRTPLSELLAHRSFRYLHNTQQTQETNVHDLNRIRTHESRNRRPMS